MRDIAREELIAELQRLRPDFEGRGVTHMSLFGSRARRDNRPDSDVDLVIEISDQADEGFSLLDLIGVGHIIEDNIGLEANLLMRRSLSGSFRSTVARDQVHVF
jgi:predicted nucleotidyltransferase